MNKQPKVSVVVPIYGVEKYLHQCVDSILAQTLTDIEIILVDDGSKDNCPKIVDEYAKKDSRVVAVHQPNGGYGRAVNHGIELAKGEYIGIIESDDWIEPDMYEKMYNNAKKFDTDVTKSGFYIYNSLLEEEKQNIVWKSRFQDILEAPHTAFSIEEYPLLLAFHASIWSCIYKAEFIKSQKVIESKSASYQDFPFMIETYCRAKRISVVHEALVHYRMEEGQNSSTIRRDERLIMMPVQCIEGKRILKKYGKYEKLKEEFYYHAYLACRGFYHTILWKHKKAYFKKFKELLQDLKHEEFDYKYFKSNDQKTIKRILRGQLINSLITTKLIRRFICSVHIEKYNSFCFQLLGIQLAMGRYKKRPALIKILGK